MATTAPRICVLAGPNGAGKTTSAGLLVRDRLGIERFVNADLIAQGLAGFASEAAAVAAGRLMLAQMQSLAAQRVDFAFETTLASRSLAPWLRTLRQAGYDVLLVFLSLPSPELALLRVEERVRAGGHDVPAVTIRRRYRRGLVNFHSLYRPLASAWWCYDGSNAPPTLVASGDAVTLEVVAADTWRHVDSWRSIAKH